MNGHNSLTEIQQKYEAAIRANENPPAGRKHQRQVEAYLALNECLKAENAAKRGREI